MSATNFVGAVPDAGNNTVPLTIVITGASRGIGLEFASQYAAANKQNKVFAAVRDVNAATVKTLLAAYPNVTAITLDVNDEASIRASVTAIQAQTDHINVLINNAGVIDYTSLVETTRESVLTMFNTNAASVLGVTQAYIPLLKAGTSATSPAKVFNISSNLGSNKYAAIAGQVFVAYGMSKAALNYLTTSFRHVFPDIVFIGVHPGWVQTDMTKGTPATVTPKDCVTGIRYLIATKGLENSGEYLDNVTGNIIAY